MTNKVKKQKTYTDHHGNEIPSGFIHKTDRDKHAAAERFFKKAEKLNAQMVKFKDELLTTCDDLYNRLLEENRVTIRENSKGGYTVQTIDKGIKIIVSVSETIGFNDKIDIAQVKIKEYLDEVTEGINQDIQVLINEAFKTRKGRLDTKRILGLMKLNITHPKWVEAMELIKQSIETNNTKRYVQIMQRQPDGDYKVVKLDFSSL